VLNLNAEQESVARLLYGLVVHVRGLPSRVSVAVICCAITEASLRNLPIGDRSPITGQQSTSLGLFQQTAGYGPAADRMDPGKALGMFLDGGPQGQPAFLKTAYNTGDLDRLAECIQFVQGSEYDGKQHYDMIARRYVTRPFAANYKANVAAAQQIVNDIEGAPAVAFSPDSNLVGQVLPQPNYTAGPVSKSYIVLHDIECPPGSGWAESLGGPNYLQNPAEQHSVHYIVDADSVVQGRPESDWAWGCGTPGSKHGIQIEQAGYASFSRGQWLGTAAGSTYTRPNGQRSDYTEQDGRDMAAQLELLAKLIADICKRYNWSPTWASDSEIRAAANGADLGKLSYHAQITRAVGGTVHTDPGENYPFDVLAAKAAGYLSGKPVIDPPDPHTGDDDVSDALDYLKSDEFLNRVKNAILTSPVTYLKTDNTTGEERPSEPRQLVQVIGDVATLLERAEYRIQEQDHRAQGAKV
jgi:hypothetical protein